MNRALQLIMGVIFFSIIGVAVLQESTALNPQNERASVHNADPRGLMLLHDWLQRSAIKSSIQTQLNDEHGPHQETLWVVPPPENASWLPGEVATLLDRVKNRGDAVLILCDPDRLRPGNLKAWFERTGIQCKGEPRPTEAMSERFGSPLFQEDNLTIAMRTRGWFETKPDVLWWPLFQEKDGRPLLIESKIGKGSVYVALSASMFQNDGLGNYDHGFVLKELLIRGRAVVIDEAHHMSRTRDMVTRALRKESVQLGFFAFLLLIPLSLLGLAPRAGDPPSGGQTQTTGGVQHEIRALASLYSLVGLGTHSNSDDDEGEQPHDRT